MLSSPQIDLFSTGIFVINKKTEGIVNEKKQQLGKELNFSWFNGCYHIVFRDVHAILVPKKLYQVKNIFRVCVFEVEEKP